MAKHQTIRFALNLSYEQYSLYYQGLVRYVSVVADDGKSVAFPAGKVQSFLTRQGISGHFEMKLTKENKFVSIKKL